jgi:hypothetical protein
VRGNINAQQRAATDAIQPPPLENLSRDMRPVLRRLKQGLAIMIESRDITDEWIDLIEVSGITFEDQETQPH